MSLQAFLARLYVDPRFREQFFADPDAVARASGLPQEEALAVRAMNRAEVELAAASFQSKRDARTAGFSRLDPSRSGTNHRGPSRAG